MFPRAPFSVPSKLIYTQSYGLFRFVKMKKSVMIFCSDQSKFDRLDSANPEAFFSEDCDLFTIPKLYRLKKSNEDFTFNFGKIAAEDHLPDASLHVNWSTDSAEPRFSDVPSEERHPTNLQFTEDEIYWASPFSRPGKIKQNFLAIQASVKMPAFISIKQQEKQLHVKPVIFTLDGEFLGLLDPDPKSGDKLKTVKQNVYVIPFIQPSTKPFVVFEVGDPEDDGIVEYEEDA